MSPADEPEVEESRRRAKQKKAVEDVRAACKADGLSDRMTDEVVTSLAGAFTMGNAFRKMFGQ